MKWFKSLFTRALMLSGIFSLILGLCLVSCGGDSDDDKDKWFGGDSKLSFDLSDAKAIATSEEAKGRSDAEDAFGLVKIMEDGSIESAMEMEGGGYLPEMQFLATSPVEGAKDLYVSFSWEIRMWEFDEETNTDSETNLGSFLHIKPDGTYVPILEGSTSSVMNDNWWGAESFKPVCFDNDGNLYFTTRNYSSGGGKSGVFKYNPTTETTSAIIPELDNMEYRAFEIDPTGTNLFVLGEKWSDQSSTSFFRMYPLSDPNQYKNIYYSSDSNVWVRGFKISPDGQTVVLNGWNIRGINGILKVNIGEDNELTYESVFSEQDTSSEQWFDPVYWEWMDWNNQVQFGGLFDQFSTDGMYILVTTGSSFYYTRMDESANEYNGYVYVSDGTTVYYSWKYQVVDPSNNGSTRVLMTNGTTFYTAYEWDLEWENKDRILMTDGTEFFLANSWDFDYYDPPDSPLWYYDTSYTWDSGTIGTDIYFATNTTDPSATSAATDLSGITNPIYVRSLWVYDADGNGSEKFLGMNLWYATDEGDASAKSAETVYANIYSTAIKKYTIDYYSVTTDNWMGSAVLGNEIFISTNESNPAEYDGAATTFQEVIDNGNTPAELVNVTYYRHDDANQYMEWYSEGVIGTDIHFATDEDDASQYSSYTTIQDMNDNGETPFMKKEEWWWDEASQTQMYELKDVDPTIASAIISEPDVCSWYTWNKHWHVDEDIANPLNESALKSYLGSFFIDETFFTWKDGETTLTGSAAITQALADAPYNALTVWGENTWWGTDSWFFIKNTMKKAVTVDSVTTYEPATTFQEFRENSDLGWLNFSDIGNMFFASDGSLWGVLGGGSWSEIDPKPVKLLDADGNRDLQIINAFSGDDYTPVGFTMKGQYFYFRDAQLDSDGFESGYHKMYRFIMGDVTPEIEDILVNVPNNGYIEILDFSIGGGFLYFTGLYGVSIVGGKVNLETLEYTPFEEGARLSNIEVY